MDKKAIRQIVTDLGVLLKDFNYKFQDIKTELSEQREEQIKGIMERVFKSELSKRLVMSKYKISGKVIRRMLKEAGKEVRKMELDGVNGVIYSLKGLSDSNKLMVADYILSRVHINILRRKIGQQRKNELLTTPFFTS